MRNRLLIAEDDVTMSGLLASLAKESGFIAQCFTDGKLAAEACLIDPPDAILADIQMPGMNGLDLIETVAVNFPGIPVAIITGFATVPDVVRAFRAGAIDLVTKPFDNQDVRAVLARFTRYLEREQRVEVLTQRLTQLESKNILPIANSRSMKQTMNLVAKVASLDTAVLLNGETGTGKGVLAKVIHNSSSRHSGPWFSVNCGALADSVAESELFGHERGAFTGANTRKRGILELAHGGTLFLDEINSASSGIQTRLLDFVQEHTLRRVGGEQAIEVDVRLITASNQDLEQLVKEGSFREDLWYRLNIFPITLPALRERREDILPLAENFLIRLAHDLNRPARQFNDDVEQLLRDYHWPGNVRQLENIIHRAVVLAESSIIKKQHLTEEISGSISSPNFASWGPDASLDEIESCWITHMIARCEGNKTEAARRLGIDVSTLHRKIRDTI